ncbi:MAG: hypothetical protein U5J83_06605 [Bryobacterales bacterium]|nr:hypothetical protein [Bryobacterales bacterium]
MFKRRILYLLLGDAGLLAGSYTIAFLFARSQGYIPSMDFDLFLLLDNGLIEIAGVVATVLLGMYFLGLYERIRVQSLAGLMQDLLLVFGVAFLVTGAYRELFENANRPLALDHALWIGSRGRGADCLAIVLWL